MIFDFKVFFFDFVFVASVSSTGHGNSLFCLFQAFFDVVVSGEGFFFLFPLDSFLLFNFHSDLVGSHSFESFFFLRGLILFLWLLLLAEGVFEVPDEILEFFIVFFSFFRLHDLLYFIHFLVMLDFIDFFALIYLLLLLFQLFLGKLLVLFLLIFGQLSLIFWLLF